MLIYRLMSDIYKDHPNVLERWVTNLTEVETKAFNTGMAFGFRIAAEYMTEMKVRAYSAVMEAEGDSEHVAQLYARVDSLDSAEQFFSKRATDLNAAI